MDRHQLEQTLRRVDPTVRLVNERHLRRGLNRLAEAGHRVATGLEHAHRLSRALFEQTAEFPHPVTDGDGDSRLVLVEPGDRISGDLPDADILRVYWELLFEAAVVDRLTAVGGDRWVALGEAETAEAMFRLRRAQVIPPDPTPAEQYAAFVGEYLTLHRFAPEVLAFTYPSIDAEVVLRLSALDFDADTLFAQTKPDGAADPAPVQPSTPESPAAGAASTSANEFHLRQAERATAKGNLARAAILRTRGGDATAADALTDGLVPKLAAIFGWSEAEQQEWADALATVLPAAAAGYWSPAAMGLYDLQKIPLDLGKELYSIDPGDWLRSLFRRPLVRQLTLARQALLVSHLIAARRHFARVPSAAIATPILTILDRQIERADADLRVQLRPRIVDALAPLAPRNVPETVARDTVVEELIDTICHRGYARLGDLRDAVARHSVKLDDLSTPGEFVRGDALLRADASLGAALDGLYRPGEAYLRLVQRGSSLAFGTRLGRWLTQFVAIPFGGAVLLVEFARYLWHELGLLYSFLSGLVGDAPAEPAHPPETAHPEGHGGAELFDPLSLAAILFIGVLFLGLLHSRPFRYLFGRVLSRAGRGVRWALVTMPLWVWNSPPVRAVRLHPVSRFMADRLGYPLVVGVALGAGLWAFQASPQRAMAWGGGAFAVLAVALNTPSGRLWQDHFEEAVSDIWRNVRRNLIPGVVGFFTWMFREAIGAIDNALYTVDEWLRFREGQSKPALAGKALLAFVWFPVAYVVRFAFYLLIEPQVNPVKHFPVVTVSHKLLLPMIPSLADMTGLSVLTVGWVISGVPGIFGFIVWELKENWRLYAANRPRRLGPLSIGHHGETVAGLLTPGFHSGTVPAAFEKARAALIKERHTGRPAKVGRAAESLHHVEDAVRRFLNRELLALLATARVWDGLTTTVGEVHLGLQRITARVCFTHVSERPTVIEFARLHQRIVVRVVVRGALDRLNTEQLAVWNHAMKGLLAKGAAADGPEWDEWVGFWNGHTG